MTLEQIEAWLKTNGYELKQGYWKRGTGRYNICPKTLRHEVFVKKDGDNKAKWHRIRSGYFSQLYIDKNGDIGGMR
jgi:hypothetical protein